MFFSVTVVYPIVTNLVGFAGLICPLYKKTDEVTSSFTENLSKAK